MPTPSRTPGQLASRRPGQSKATSASQVPLPARVVPDSTGVPSATKLPGATENRKIGQSTVPTSLAFRGAAPSPSRTKISSSSQSVAPSRTYRQREHPSPIAELPSITETGQCQTPKAASGGGSIIRLPGGRTMVSMYTTPEDVSRAEKQLSYAILPSEEKVEQDIWANEKGKDLAPCPNNLSWVRCEMHQGYRCSGGVSITVNPYVALALPENLALRLTDTSFVTDALHPRHIDRRRCAGLVYNSTAPGSSHRQFNAAPHGEHSPRVFRRCAPGA